MELIPYHRVILPLSQKKVLLLCSQSPKLDIYFLFARNFIIHKPVKLCVLYDTYIYIEQLGF